MGDDGPKVIYRTRIRVRTAVLVAVFLTLLGVYGYTSERYPATQEQVVRPLTGNQRTQAPEPTAPASTSAPESSTPESTGSSASTTTTTDDDEQSTGDTTETTDTSTSARSRPTLTTTSVPGVPVPIPRITTGDGTETTTAEESR